jgi:hypothetical protein
MSRTLTDGEREILAELNRDAESGLEIEEGQCPECYGSGIEGILPDDTEVSCKWCDGTGKEG